MMPIKNNDIEIRYDDSMGGGAENLQIHGSVVAERAGESRFLELFGVNLKLFFGNPFGNGGWCLEMIDDLHTRRSHQVICARYQQELLHHCQAIVPRKSRL